MVGGTTSFFQEQHNFTWQQFLDDEEDDFSLTAFVRLSAPVSGSKLWLSFPPEAGDGYPGASRSLHGQPAKKGTRKDW
jgi:hypothetical protein